MQSSSHVNHAQQSGSDADSENSSAPSSPPLFSFITNNSHHQAETDADDEHLSDETSVSVAEDGYEATEISAEEIEETDSSDEEALISDSSSEQSDTSDWQSEADSEEETSDAKLETTSESSESSIISEDSDIYDNDPNEISISLLLKLRESKSDDILTKILVDQMNALTTESKQLPHEATLDEYLVTATFVGTDVSVWDNFHNLILAMHRNHLKEAYLHLQTLYRQTQDGHAPKSELVDQLLFALIRLATKEYILFEETDKRLQLILGYCIAISAAMNNTTTIEPYILAQPSIAVYINRLPVILSAELIWPIIEAYFTAYSLCKKSATNTALGFVVPSSFLVMYLDFCIKNSIASELLLSCLFSSAVKHPPLADETSDSFAKYFDQPSSIFYLARYYDSVCYDVARSAAALSIYEMILLNQQGSIDADKKIREFFRAYLDILALNDRALLNLFEKVCLSVQDGPEMRFSREAFLLHWALFKESTTPHRRSSQALLTSFFRLNAKEFDNEHDEKAEATPLKRKREENAYPAESKPTAITLVTESVDEEEDNKDKIESSKHFKHGR